MIKFEELDNIGDLIKLESFPGFFRYNGFGLLATSTQQSNIELDFRKLPKIKEKYPWCTHIQWYNK